MRPVYTLLVLFLTTGPLFAAPQDCTGTSVGFVPLNDRMDGA